MVFLVLVLKIMHSLGCSPGDDRVVLVVVASPDIVGSLGTSPGDCRWPWS